jgi:hypothetical protein
MMLNGGQLDGVRLLSPTTVKYMTSDHLGDIKARDSLRCRQQSVSALGFAVRGRPVCSRSQERPANISGSAAGTGFRGPEKQVICVLMTQAMPGMQRRYDRYLFKQLVYQAITD